MTALRLSPTTVGGGATATGIVTLARAAPPAGTVVSIGSSKPGVVWAPSAVTVGAGQVTATFAASTAAVPTATSATLSASSGSGTPRTATLTVALPTMKSIALSPSTVVGGSSASATVRLSGPAPAGGIAVILKSSRPAQAAVPASVTVAEGQTGATFGVTTTPVPARTSALISGTYRGATKTATLTIER